MLTVYVFCLILSGGLLGVSIFSDFLDVDVADVDLDTDVDADVSVETDVQAMKIFSIRGLLYLLLGFGLVGTLLSFVWGGEQPVLTAAMAGGAGIASGGLATAIFNWLKRSESGARLTEGSFVGLAGRMTIPFSASGTGKVRVERGDRVYELIAQPFDEEATQIDQWSNVVVVEMKDGRALVVPESEGLLPEG